MKKLSDWSVIDHRNENKARLFGVVTGDGRFSDGDKIIVSRLVGKTQDLVVTESGSRYVLGEVDPEYERAYPNARERLFSTLTQL